MNFNFEKDREERRRARYRGDASRVRYKREASSEFVIETAEYGKISSQIANISLGKQENLKDTPNLQRLDASIEQNSNYIDSNYDYNYGDISAAPENDTVESINIESEELDKEHTGGLDIRWTPDLKNKKSRNRNNESYNMRSNGCYKTSKALLNNESSHDTEDNRDKAPLDENEMCTVEEMKKEKTNKRSAVTTTADDSQKCEQSQEEMQIEREDDASNISTRPGRTKNPKVPKARREHIKHTSEINPTTCAAPTRLTRSMAKKLGGVQPVRRHYGEGVSSSQILQLRDKSSNDY